MTPATILDGRKVAAEIKSELKVRINGRKIGLGTILVGNDPASASYIDGKHRDCAEVGITSIRRELPSDISESALINEIEALNSDQRCTGFIVQLPLPKVTTKELSQFAFGNDLLGFVKEHRRINPGLSVAEAKSDFQHFRNIIEKRG